MTTLDIQRRSSIDYTNEQLQLIKQTVAAGTTDLEFQLFIEISRTVGLLPLQKQIYAIMRNERYQDDQGNWKSRQRMTIQTGIDGYRLIAARTGQHVGTSDPEYGLEDSEGNPTWARVVVRRATSSGHIAEFAATCRWREYAQTDKNGKPIAMWARMPFLMLGKVAESLALRKAFPAELSGVYTAEEMSQADSSPIEVQPVVPQDPLERRLGAKQRQQFTERLEGLGITDVIGFIVWVLQDDAASLETITLGQSARIVKAAESEKALMVKEAEAQDAEFTPST